MKPWRYAIALLLLMCSACSPTKSFAGIRSGVAPCINGLSAAETDEGAVSADAYSLSVQFPRKACTLGFTIAQLPERWNASGMPSDSLLRGTQKEPDSRMVHGLFSTTPSDAHPMDGDMKLHIGVLGDGTTVSALSLSITIADGSVDRSTAVAAATNLVTAIEGPENSSDVVAQLGVSIQNIGQIAARDFGTPTAQYYYAANEGQLIVSAVGISEG